MTTRAAEIRAGLSHPIIDADGHFVEVAPLLERGDAHVPRGDGRPRGCATATRRDTGLTDTSTVLADHAGAAGAGWKAMPSWWGWATENTRDRATAHLPALLYERLDEIGIDFTILYPSMTLAYLEVADDELIGLRCRAANRALAEPLRGLPRPHAPSARWSRCSTRSSRSTSSSTRCASSGFKTAVFAGHARGARSASDGAYRLDTFGVDSAYDYDPLWAKCVELGVAPVFHSSLQSHRVTRSATSYVYNHIGGLAASHESLCKSLFLSGVTHRFPTLALRLPRRRRGVGVQPARPTSSVTGRSATRRRSQSLDPDLLDVDALHRALRPLRRRARARRTRRAARVLRAPERASRAARRVRGGRA